MSVSRSVGQKDIRWETELLFGLLILVSLSLLTDSYLYLHALHSYMLSLLSVSSMSLLLILVGLKAELWWTEHCFYLLTL